MRMLTLRHLRWAPQIQHTRHAHSLKASGAELSAHCSWGVDHKQPCRVVALPPVALSAFAASLYKYCFLPCNLLQALLKAKHLTCLSASHLTDGTLSDCLSKLRRLCELHIQQSCVTNGPKGLQQLTALKQLTALRVDVVYTGRGSVSFWQSPGSLDHAADVAMRPLHIVNKVGGALHTSDRRRESVGAEAELAPVLLLSGATFEDTTGICQADTLHGMSYQASCEAHPV